jgi:predicted nucleic acid-binding protein
MPSPRERPNVLVVDASVMAPAIADAGEDGQRFRDRLRGETIAGPDLLRIEVMSVVRRHENAGSLTSEQAEAAFEDLVDLPISVFPAAPLLPRMWELRYNLTSYDSCYVALAEALDGPLLTADSRLANAPGARCVIEVL